MRRLSAPGPGRAGAVLSHEGVELFLVLGVAQACQEILELLLLFFKTTQRLHAVFVEGAVAARGRTETEAEAAALHAIPHAIHVGLHPLHLGLPAIAVVVTPARHSSAP